MQVMTTQLIENAQHEAGRDGPASLFALSHDCLWYYNMEW